MLEETTGKSFPLTPHQLEGLQALIDREINGEQFFLLKGSAGTGKTTLVTNYCDHLRKSRRVLLTAPTHKAAEVLRKNSVVECATLHSFLRMERVFNRDTRSYEFTYDPEVELKEIDELIVDEASMVGSKMLGYITQAAITHKFNVIFVGDEKQLNPVNELHSLVFHSAITEFELTEIIRHQNDIISLSRNLHWLTEKKNGECFEWLDPRSLDLGALVEANGSDAAKFITWTNRSVGAINSQIRNEIYGQPEQFETGETILLTSSFSGVSDGYEYANNQEILVNNVTDSHVWFDKAPVPFKSIDTFLINDNLQAVNDSGMKKHTANIEYLTTEKKWRLLADYKELFLKYQHNHAITVHRSQGSTYGTAFINVSEISRNRNKAEKERMLYTAITRASKKDYLV